MRLLLVPAITVLCVLCDASFGCVQAHAQETDEQKFVISIERIWDRAAHSAFTDLIRFHGMLYCTFREGSDHIPGLNGSIRVLRSRDGQNWESVALVDERHVDLRDPKLSITSDGRLMVNTGASYYEGSTRKRIESRVIFSDSAGDTFGKPIRVELPESIVTGMDWLWRVTWHKGVAWGAVQQVPGPDGTGAAKRQLQLVRSDDGIHWQHVSTMPVEGPSETTLRFLPDDTLIALTRAQGNPPRGQLGVARPPYTEWNYRPTNKALGGPNLLALPGGGWLVGSRDYDAKPYTTALWGLDFERAEFFPVLAFPSGGDTSYPGFVLDPDNDRLLVSYYSGHEGKPAIYLATLRLSAVTEAVRR